MSNKIVFKPSPGHLLVRPLKKTDAGAGGITFAVQETSLPMGEVLAIGDKPSHIRVTKLKVGETVVFAGASATEIDVLVDGIQERCRVLSYAELRGVFRDENDDSFLVRTTRLLRRWFSPLGFLLAGVIVGGGIGTFVGMAAAAKSRLRKRAAGKDSVHGGVGGPDTAGR